MYKIGMKLKYKLEKPTHFYSEGQYSMRKFGNIEEIKYIEEGIVYLADRHKTSRGEYWFDDGVSFPIEVIEVMFDVVEE